MKIKILLFFIFFFVNPHGIADDKIKPNRRMPHKLEIEMLKKFELRKLKSESWLNKN